MRTASYGRPRVRATSLSGRPSRRVRATRTTSRGLRTPATTAAANRGGEHVALGLGRVEAFGQRLGLERTLPADQRDPPCPVPDGIAALPAPRRRSSRDHLPGGTERVGLGVAGVDPAAAHQTVAHHLEFAAEHGQERQRGQLVGGRLFGQALDDADGRPAVSVAASEESGQIATVSLGRARRCNASGQASGFGTVQSRRHVVGQGLEC